VVVRSQLLENSIVLMIADTGIGIAPQSLQATGQAVSSRLKAS